MAQGQPAVAGQPAKKHSITQRYRSSRHRRGPRRERIAGMACTSAIGASAVSSSHATGRDQSGWGELVRQVCAEASRTLVVDVDPQDLASWWADNAGERLPFDFTQEADPVVLGQTAGKRYDVPSQQKHKQHGPVISTKLAVSFELKTECLRIRSHSSKHRE